MGGGYFGPESLTKAHSRLSKDALPRAVRNVLSALNRRFGERCGMGRRAGYAGGLLRCPGAEPVIGGVYGNGGS